MEQFVSQDPRSYSLYFDLNIWFRARKVTGTFEKRAPGLEQSDSHVCLTYVKQPKDVAKKYVMPPFLYKYILIYFATNLPHKNIAIFETNLSIRQRKLPLCFFFY